MNRCLFATVLIVLCTSPAIAQDPLELEPADNLVGDGNWGLAITPYAWFAANATDVGGQTLRQSFNDLASITDLGFQCRLLARYRWLLFAADWTYADQKSDTAIARTSVKFDLTQHILDLKFAGKVFDSRSGARNSGIGVWVGAGARYWNNAVDFTITREPILPSDSPEVTKSSTGQEYWDPVVGLNMHWPITPTVGFLVKLTGGGFGWGDASNYLWDAEAAANFHVARRFLVSTGYRIFKYDREDDGIEQTVTVSGPFVGVSIGIF